MIDLAIDQAKSELINAVNQIMAEHKLTPSIMGLIIESVNGEITQLKASEYANELIPYLQEKVEPPKEESKPPMPTSRVETVNVTPEELIANVKASGEKNPMLIDDKGKQISLEEYERRVKEKYES
jgi:hypothetical protein